MIQWYPGHMAKAKKLLQDNLKLIDIVIEVVDARAPNSTRNPDFEQLFSDKQKVVVLNKADLANRNVTEDWISYFEARDTISVGINSHSNKTTDKVINILNRVSEPFVKKALMKGVKKTVRAMVVGIPNVGKSTFINCLAGRKKTAVGNKPGVTKGKQWVAISKYLEILDTPGLLWPKFEDPVCGKHLAYINAINDDILNMEEISYDLYCELGDICPEKMKECFPYLDRNLNADDFYDTLCREKGFFLTNKEMDEKRASKYFLDTFRSGGLGRISLESPTE